MSFIVILCDSLSIHQKPMILYLKKISQICQIFINDILERHLTIENFAFVSKK